MQMENWILFRGDTKASGKPVSLNRGQREIHQPDDGHDESSGEFALTEYLHRDLNKVLRV